VSDSLWTRERAVALIDRQLSTSSRASTRRARGLCGSVIHSDRRAPIGFSRARGVTAN